MIVFLVILGLICAAVQIFSMRQGLDRVSFDYAPDVRETEPDAPFGVTTTLINRSRLPISYLKAEISYPLSAELPVQTVEKEHEFRKATEAVYRLKGRERVVAEVPVTLGKRGYHRFSGATLYRGDFLGFNEVAEKYMSRGSVLVYPRPSEDAEVIRTLGNLTGDIIASRHMIRDPILTACCREYTGQEPMHTISWTQTARLGEIMVREFEPVRELSCSVILLNDGRAADDEALLDKSCSIARTACEYLTSNGVVVDLYTNYAVSGYGRKITRTVRAGKENLRDILAMLGALLAKDSGSVRNLIDASCRGAAESAGFLIIAPRPSKEADDLGLALRQRSAGPIKVIYAEAQAPAAGDARDAGAAGMEGGAAC
ncbi:MAG: DUF58 domain-containing protein [Clostridia bacterium]|nr:DUF58 domain-containing protein [Clostridia bacterium]